MPPPLGRLSISHFTPWPTFRHGLLSNFKGRLSARFFFVLNKIRFHTWNHQKRFGGLIKGKDIGHSGYFMKKWRLPKEVEFKTVEVTLVSKEDAQKTRNRYHKDKIFEAFSAHVVEICENAADVRAICIPSDIKRYQAHHILPISLGGTNSFSNLALVHPRLHVYCHCHITKSVLKLKTGETRVIDIPFMPALIWIPNRGKERAEKLSQRSKTGYTPSVCA